MQVFHIELKLYIGEFSQQPREKGFILRRSWTVVILRHQCVVPLKRLMIYLNSALRRISLCFFKTLDFVGELSENSRGTLGISYVFSVALNVKVL